MPKRIALKDELVNLRDQLNAEMQSQWKRSLPFEELLSDRWQRAKSLGFAEGASIYSNSCVFGKVEVGKKTWVGPYTILDASGGVIRIGEFCNLSVGVQVYTHDTVYWCLSGGVAPARKGDVSIGSCTYIGPNCIIQRNVTIGDHCVIGANSLVNRSIPPFSFAYGSPCKVKGRVVQDPSGNFRIELK
jgi:acetyltransferase-like isoleucine patch superfamily enzyme